MGSWQSFMSLHLKLLDIDHPLSFEQSKLKQIKAHALIYLSATICRIRENTPGDDILKTVSKLKEKSRRIGEVAMY